MADSGLIWRGSHNRMRPCAWNFAQFEKDILECCVYLPSNVGKLTIAGRAGKYTLPVCYITPKLILCMYKILTPLCCLTLNKDPIRVVRAISAAVRFNHILLTGKTV
jgi:hypothetical protein